MFFVLFSCDSLIILSNHCSFVKHFFIFLNSVLSSLSCDSSFILSKCFAFVKNFFHFLLYLCFKAKESAGGGIRTHAPLRTNGFQDRLVMTTSIPLHHAVLWSYAVLAVISNCYPPVQGRLPTRYSPVRHSVYKTSIPKEIC